MAKLPEPVPAAPTKVTKRPVKKATDATQEPVAAAKEQPDPTPQTTAEPSLVDQLRVQRQIKANVGLG